jgi:hypothetical protein
LISATNAQTWHRRHQLDGHRSLSIFGAFAGCALFNG